MFEQFHFLQPLWFLALIPLALLLWWLPRAGYAGSHWQRACESHLLPYLLNKPVQAFSQLPVWLLTLGGLLAAVALADPAWQKQSQPVYRSQDAEVVVLDLSRSMLSADLTPSRLERARFKLADILNRRKEGQTGLVVFAGDAFTVAPLTNDARTIQALLAPLSPDLMPVQGSRADLGLRQAGKLLQQAGVTRGDILLITDGYSDARTVDVAADLQRQGYRLSVLGVGSDKPAPIPDGQGGFVRDNHGRVVMPSLDVAKLRQLANAGGGRYSSITAGDADLTQVLPSAQQTPAMRMQSTTQTTDLWQSQGPWLVLALLPLAALAFRRGWLLLLPLVMLVTLGGFPRPAMASGWDDLWQRHDQQADQALHTGDYARAQKLAQQPLQRGEAAYRAGDYAKALNAFSASDTAQGHYNSGNTLAQLGRYQDAIAAYDQALTKLPGMPDALHNKQELEKLLKQQQKKQQANNKGGDSKDKNGQQQADKNSDGNGKDHAGQQQADKGKANDDKKKGAGKDKNGQQQAGNNGGAGKDQGSQQQVSNDKRGAGKDKNSQQQAAGSQGGEGKDQGNAQQADAQALAKKQAGAEGQVGQQGKTGQARSAAADAGLDTASNEQKQADERWLRRIPDDPGGLLRRKFLYQYSQRAKQQDTAEQSW